MKRLLTETGIHFYDVRLGEAEIDDSTPEDRLNDLTQRMEEEGFERIIDPESALIENIKLNVMRYVRTEENNLYNLSQYLQDNIGINYDTLSRVFSAREGRTIEKYQIAQKVEYVKELINYQELTLSEIAYKTRYSSAAHMSRQFKSVTGLTPTEYSKSSRLRLGLNEV
ncbi:MAG: AraC family transcriptional regulator [Muribaculum sp.]|nr:AraC family transcriptional regulator [Muribaculum sp.]